MLSSIVGAKVSRIVTDVGVEDSLGKITYSGHDHPGESRYERHAWGLSQSSPPLQNHQLLPSGTHAAFPPTPPRREFIAKRENGDEPSLPQMRRPNSTGTVPEGMPPLIPLFFIQKHIWTIIEDRQALITEDASPHRE